MSVFDERTETRPLDRSVAVMGHRYAWAAPLEEWSLVQVDGDRWVVFHQIVSQTNGLAFEEFAAAGAFD